ncbi:MAG: COX15/CtaA family protein [Immundisolibacteraceae bacterium]|nr:COX15/CtaA family protein [Immundisolibacteraceae bacterium]
MKTWLPLAATLLALVVVVLGAYTRLSDAGLGCPDWPGCYGQIGVPEGAEEVSAANQAYPDRPVEASKAWKEMIHRYAAGLLGLLVLFMFIRAWTVFPAQRLFTTGLLILVTFQALLGMWTVTLLVKPLVVTGHLIGGMATVSLLWLLVLQRSGSFYRAADLSAAQRKLPLLMLVVLILQILLGGWTSTNYAALACVGLPDCNGLWLPTMDFANGFKPWHGLGIDYEGGILESPARIAIHFSHRIGAIFTLLMIGGSTVLLWRSCDDQLMRRCLVAVAMVLVAQFSLGLANVWFYLPLPVAVAHNGVAALLLMSVVTVNYLAFTNTERMPV